MANVCSDLIEVREARGIRTLHFGSDWVQGAMRVSRPWDLELAYTREMMAALLLSPNWPSMPQRILQIGLGAGSLARFIYRYLPQANQVVVEQSASVVGAAHQGFHLPPPDDRLQIEVAEGSAWLANSVQHFDLILVDGFDADGKTGDLESLDFYQQCRKHLSPEGLVSVNLLSRSPNFLESCLTLNAAFEGCMRLLPQTPGGNVIALAAASDTQVLDEALLRARTAVLAKRCHLDLGSLVERLVAEEGELPFGLFR